MEAAEPRCQGSQQDAETGPPVVQVYSMYSYLWTIQAVRDPCVHRSQRRRQEG